jgi:hypothetical protein
MALDPAHLLPDPVAKRLGRTRRTAMPREAPRRCLLPDQAAKRLGSRGDWRCRGRPHAGVQEVAWGRAWEEEVVWGRAWEDEWVSGLLRPNSSDDGAAVRLRSNGVSAALAVWLHVLEVRLIEGCVKV